MEARTALTQPTSLIDFNGLKRYSCLQVDLINRFCRACRRSSDWTAWFREGFAQWLEIYKGTAIRLLMTNEIEPREAKGYRFESDEIRIGRSSESHIVLGVRALGKQHARVVGKEGNYYLEDLGSAIGTYLNDRKLIPGEPELLNDGDRFLIFPFRFQVALEAIWIRDDHLEFSGTTVAVTTRSEFESTIPLGFCSFEIAIYPEAGEAVIAASRPFLETVVSRLTRAPVATLVASDDGLFEFLVVSVLERVNREIAFPLQVALQRSILRSPDEQGLKLELCIALREATGIFQLFLPRKALVSMQRIWPKPPSPPVNGIKWRIFVCAGRIELSLSEASELAPGDVLLFAEDMEVLLPHYPSSAAPERGWKARQLLSAPLRIEVKEYFERDLSMDNAIDSPVDASPQEQNPEALGKPDLTSLPVRLHVILGEIELSLADLHALTRNSILELDWAKEDPVQLAANGKVIGTGSLVEIEGKIGVEITGWSGS